MSRPCVCDPDSHPFAVTSADSAGGAGSRPGFQFGRLGRDASGQRNHRFGVCGIASGGTDANATEKRKNAIILVRDLRDNEVLFIRTPSVDFHASVSRWPASRGVIAPAHAPLLGVFFVASLLAVATWACSNQPQFVGAVGAPVEAALMGSRVSATPTATPTPPPSD